MIGALVTAVAQGRGGLLVIEGPPGIGKSRLLTEVMAPFFSLFMATLHADPPIGDAEGGA